MPRFINTELKSNLESQSDSEAQSKSETGLMAKLNLMLILKSHFTFNLRVSVFFSKSKGIFVYNIFIFS